MPQVFLNAFHRNPCEVVKYALRDRLKVYGDFGGKGVLVAFNDFLCRVMFGLHDSHRINLSLCKQFICDKGIHYGYVILQCTYRDRENP